MAEMFSMDQGDLQRLLKYYKAAPVKFERAAAAMLNEFATGVHRIAIWNIQRHMVIRNPSFVKSSVRMIRAKPGPMRTMQAQTFSIKRDRFSGWIEQETGQKTDRTRTQTLSARGGDIKNKIPNAIRMKPNNYFHEAKNFRSKYSKTRGQKFVAMSEAIRTGKVARKPFIIRTRMSGKLSSYKRGLYMFVERGSTTYSSTSKLKGRRGQTRNLKGRFTRVQSFRARDVQPVRKQWMEPARTEYFSKVNIKMEWHDKLIKMGVLKIK